MTMASTPPASLPPASSSSTAAPWTIHLFTLFPEMWPGPLGLSLAGKALAGKASAGNSLEGRRGLWQLRVTDIRDHATDKHQTVDDASYGGGTGLVLRPDVMDAALRANLPMEGAKPRLLLMSPRGRVLDQALVVEMAAEAALAIVCPRYEGLDQRVIDAHEMEEVSVGDYILSGGDLAAMLLLDACLRLRPGVIGTDLVHHEESFGANGLLEYPHYTRPASWQGRSVPAVLTSGNHQAIAEWRLQQSKEITLARRPDLWVKCLSQE
jgi:tRNA (guanine37-N1)-methyltransferase